MRTRFGGAFVVLVFVALGRAQQPTIPGAPALPGGPVPAVTGAAATTAAPAAAAPAAPKNIWSFFMKTPEQKAQCKAHFCNSRIGSFINNLLVPAGVATGGLLGPICPPPGIGGPGSGAPNPDDLKKSPTSPEGAAAKIKQEEAQAKAKVAALEYLGTVDCRYYPEAEAGLITGLRAEKNECVRIAAAKALASGCCCSPKIVKALLISVNCSNKDGFPAEASELVRTYAFVALERCLRKCVEEEPEAPPEPPPAAKKAMYELLTPMGATVDYSAHILLAAYYPMEPRETAAQVYADARQALARGLKLSPQTMSRLSGPKNLRDGVFPPDTQRAPTSVASISSLAWPSMPSFASIRKSASAPREVPAEPPLLAPMPAAPTEPPVAPTRQDTFAAPVTMPPALTTPVRSGRGNLSSIFQDAWKR